MVKKCVRLFYKFPGKLQREKMNSYTSEGQLVLGSFEINS